MTDEEKANFDYNKCLEVRGKLPKKLSRPRKLPKRGSGPNGQERERGDTAKMGAFGVLFASIFSQFRSHFCFFWICRSWQELANTAGIHENPNFEEQSNKKAEFAHFLCNLGLFCLHFTHCKPLAILASRCDLWPFWVWLSDSITFPVMETSPPLVEKATVCLLLVLMMILHIAFSQAGLKGSLLPLWEWRNSGRERERTQRQIEQDLRFEMEIMKTRMQNFSKVSGYFSKSFFFFV